MSKKITIDQESCIGCGACANLCPKVFEMQEDGKAKVVELGDGDKCDYETTIQICPVGAIEIE